MTKEAKPRIGAGDVVIVLGDEERVLRPTLGAMQAISRQTGGIRRAIEGVLALDLDVAVTVVQHGLGLTPNGAKQLNIPQLVYEAGFSDDTGAICERLVTYLRILASGGRVPNDDVDEEASQDIADPQKPKRNTRTGSAG